MISALNTYCSVDKIEKNEVGWACSAYGGGVRDVYRVLEGKPEGKRQHGRPRMIILIWMFRK
jgi:hypothetical protein